jgi:predicted GH43/DUF377 family glycosyl hydrolase
LRPDPRRVVVRPFHLAWQASGTEPSRALRLVENVLGLTNEQVTDELERVYRDFDARHWQVEKVFERRYEQLVEQFDEVIHPAALTPRRRQLLGAYFCHEYSYAAAAIMNPSVVAAPDQSGMTDGAVRFAMSLRTVGEGHISSIAFTQGIVSPGREVSIPEAPRIATAADVSAVKRGEPLVPGAPVTVYRHADSDLSRTVIFPMTEAQRNGLEDLRITPFLHSTGKTEWIGTYTAYDGRTIRSEMMRTKDFRKFELVPMTGRAARNKGMALFPRKVGGRYAMLGRQDNENIWLHLSDDVLHWEGGEKIITPRYPWEFVQMGNCGSPTEIDEGWLVMTHGVGTVRNYCIGACLLDKDDPTKLLARTPRPVLAPSPHERDGYVPNVVYSCGALVAGRTMLLPYAVADSFTAFATASIDDLLSVME